MNSICRHLASGVYIFKDCEAGSFHRGGGGGAKNCVFVPSDKNSGCYGNKKYDFHRLTMG